MNWQLFLAILGSTSGIISLLGLIYTLGWKLGRLSLKVDLLWKVYVEQMLSGESSNPGMETFPEEVKDKIQKILGKKKVKKEGFEDKLLYVIEEIKLEELKRITGEKSTQRLIKNIALFIQQESS